MEELEQIILHIINEKPESKAQFDDARRKICSKLKINQPPNRALLSAYQSLLKNKSIERDELIEKFIRKANIRSLSGIAVITSLVKSYPCPGKCVYCPLEARMPKSYLASEPAAARSLSLDFDPYELMLQRIHMLEGNGHPCDKIEYIIKGGTWNAYTLKYQYWYILESFRACNNLSRETPTPKTSEEDWTNIPLENLQKAVEEEQVFNETADYRIIGLTLETRPDAISPKTIYHMRQQGCTRIELGLQAPDNKILEYIKRGHTVEQFYDAIKLLRDAGFKVDLHFMPDLPSSTPEHDVEMYKSIFENPKLRPDMVKIYPCTVIKSAELASWLESGKHTPYNEKELFDALLQMKLLTPRYCRISRLIRDIPSDEVSAGNKITNLREMLSAKTKEQGKLCVCLRCREISRQEKNIPKDTVPQLFVDEYETDGGTEYFITFEDPNRISVFGFLRLRIPEHNNDSKEKARLFELIPEIKNAAFIRELHTYGQLVGIGEKSESAAQHKGLGKRLVSEAEKISINLGYRKLAVISGVGVKEYYRKLGYEKDGTYMVKNL